jgi:two-component system, chemotaxis family, protein-glutamate methylesterase/glutaminase
MRLSPGEVVVAAGGQHLEIARSGDHVVASLRVEPIELPHRPSVDVLFRSAAAVHGAGVLGVVLTGMGDDGCEGARAIVAAGGRVLTESEDSCVVYGMPRCVVDAGLSHATASLEEMTRLIVDSL